MSQRIVEVSREYDRSTGFLFGLYLGLLSLLILLSLFDPFYLPQGRPNLRRIILFEIPSLHEPFGIVSKSREGGHTDATPNHCQPKSMDAG